MGPLDEEMTDYVPEEEEDLRNVDGEEAIQGGEDANMPPSLSLPRRLATELLLERRPNWRNWR